SRDWSSDVCSSDLQQHPQQEAGYSPLEIDEVVIRCFLIPRFLDLRLLILVDAFKDLFQRLVVCRAKKFTFTDLGNASHRRLIYGVGIHLRSAEKVFAHGHEAFLPDDNRVNANAVRGREFGSSKRIDIAGIAVAVAK